MIDRLTRAQKRQLQRFPKAACRLPPHQKTWAQHDLELPQDALAAFSRADIIRSVGRVDPGDHPSSRTRATEWKTASGVVTYAEKRLGGQTWTPCGCSTGIRCVETGSLYSCRDDDCDAQFGRAVAEAVVNDESLPENGDRDDDSRPARRAADD